MRGFFGTQCLANNHKFGKKCTNLNLNFGVLIVGEIEQQFFHQMLCASNFLLGKKAKWDDFINMLTHSFKSHKLSAVQPLYINHFCA